MKHESWELQSMQAAPLAVKVALTKDRIREWVNHFGEDGVYVSFSGGKDSTVLLYLVREMFPDIPAVFFDTGLEYPEIREFVKTFDNVIWIRPRMNFKQVIEKYGYPFISKEMSGIIGGAQSALKILKTECVDINDEKTVIAEASARLKKQKGEWRRLAQAYGAITKDNEIKTDISDDEKGMYSDIPKKYKFLVQSDFKVSDKCCAVMKKDIAHRYSKETGRFPITAQMASESRLRKIAWLKNGCNAFDAVNKVSNPMTFWYDSDVLQYIKENHIPIASVYGDIIEAEELPGQMTWDEYAGFDTGRKNYTTTGCKRTGCMFCGYGCHLEKPGEGRFERMKETHPKQYEYIMKPWDEGGLGYKEVIDWMNEHGNLHIRY